jgi:hypothetical protein
MLSFGGKAETKPLCQCPANQNKNNGANPNDNNSKNEDKPCRKVAQEGSLFCKEHQNCTPPPTNGSEPKYIADVLNKLPEYIETHNCISYALRGNKINKDLMAQCKDVKTCSVNFEQPGAASGKRKAMRNESLRTCPTVENLTKSDLGKAFKHSSYSATCPAGTSKVALVTAKGVDYHWYRQNPDGTWSDKAGSNKVKNWDAKNRKIINPSGADRNYGDGLNYKDFCGFYCVDRTEPVRLKQGGKRKSRKHGQRKSKRAVLKGGRLTRRVRRSSDA